MSINNLIRAALKPLGLTITRIPPAADKSRDNLYDFFAHNNEEAEKFMQYVYSLIVKKGDCALDIGANHGLHTIPLSNLAGPTGKIIAVEAIKELIPDIKSKLLINNTTLINAAITNPQTANKHKQITFNYFPSLDAFSSLHPQSETNGHQGVEVKVDAQTIDKLVSQSNLEGRQVSFIKIDVEGGDYDALQGAITTLKTHRPVVIMENKRQEAADLYHYSSQDYFDLIESLNYQAFQFTGQPFTKQDWDADKVYWETWLVHQDSPVFSFFADHCQSLATVFMEDRLK